MKQLFDFYMSIYNCFKSWKWKPIVAYNMEYDAYYYYYLNEMQWYENHYFELSLEIYLLRVEDDNKSHFIYIKHIQKLLNKNTHASCANRLMCPYCDKMVDCCDFDNNYY